MRLFVSAGEPSGDLHAANLIRAVRARQAGVEFHGFGGERTAAAGGTLLYPLCELAVVGFVRVLGSLPRFAALLRIADCFLAEHRPDAVVLIDYPGFHWWLARRAKAHGIPVVYFVPPQLWAWAGWRVAKMRRLVDHVLCNLPFEEAWYRERRVPAHYVGHPYFDELREQRLDEVFVAQQRSKPGPVVALLPGSRGQELEYNLPSLTRAAALVHARRPDARFLFACLKPAHQRRAETMAHGTGLPIEAHHGKTAEIIHLAHSCIAVSGSVGLELLYRGKPSVVVYRQNPVGVAAARVVMRCRYISLVNLLAGKELFPEFLTSRCEAEGMAAHVLHWLEHPAAHEALREELAALCKRVAEPGACDRAAAFVLEVMKGASCGKRAA
jgi:lipid-A-disaccharide synthase